MPPTLVRSTPAEVKAVNALRELSQAMPERYLQFLAASNGAEGNLEVEPGWFVVWPAAEALVASREYEVPIYLPGHFAFGGNGGGELFVFDLRRDNEDPPVFMVPAIGMAVNTLVMVSPTWSAFETAMGKELEP